MAPWKPKEKPRRRVEAVSEAPAPSPAVEGGVCPRGGRSRALRVPSESVLSGFEATARNPEGSDPKRQGKAGRAKARSGRARVGGESEIRKPEGGGAPSSVVFVWV